VPHLNVRRWLARGQHLQWSVCHRQGLVDSGRVKVGASMLQKVRSNALIDVRLHLVVDVSKTVGIRIVMILSVNLPLYAKFAL
jgi:ppGpp synthetase/RelA/SpoT-type nucleotidyltranferase